MHRCDHSCDYYIFAHVHLDYNSVWMICIDFLYTCICASHASVGIFCRVTGINSALGRITAACPGDREPEVDGGLIMRSYRHVSHSGRVQGGDRRTEAITQKGRWEKKERLIY